jgi:hypothetical protein
MAVTAVSDVNRARQLSRRYPGILSRTDRGAGGHGSPRQHVVAALRAMLDRVELRAIDATTTENGVSVMLRHDNVRCVLVVSPQVPRHRAQPAGAADRPAGSRTAPPTAPSRARSTSAPWTVSTHMRRIFAKLDVCSRAEMLAQFFGGGDAGQLR